MPSSVFRDMIEAGSGTKRIALSEGSGIVNVFLTAISENVFDYGDHGSVQTNEEVVEVVKMFQKYDCKAGISLVAQFVRTYCDSPSEVLVRLLAAMHLGRDDLCADLIDHYPDSFRWMNVGTGRFPLSYREFVLFPGRYYWALARADVGHPAWKDTDECPGSPRERFEFCLGEADCHIANQK